MDCNSDADCSPSDDGIPEQCVFPVGGEKRRRLFGMEGGMPTLCSDGKACRGKCDPYACIWNNDAWLNDYFFSLEGRPATEENKPCERTPSITTVAGSLAEEGLCGSHVPQMIEQFEQLICGIPETSCWVE